MTRLKGKVAIITGGGTGIGRAIALVFGREGAKVAVLGRQRGSLDAVVKDLAQSGAEGRAILCDVTRSADTQRAVQHVEKEFGRVDVLVNNAGILIPATVENISEKEWDQVIETNLKGPFLMARAVLPALRRVGGGAIVNIGSVLGQVATKECAAYCASKGGVILLTKAMALDYAHENIRVNCICPATVETERVKEEFPQNEAGRKLREDRIRRLPLGRLGQPNDVAELAAFLASDQSTWITGTAIPVDGGLSSH